jgi:hypothetical protein
MYWLWLTMAASLALWSQSRWNWVQSGNSSKDQIIAIGVGFVTAWLLSAAISRLKPKTPIEVIQAKNQITQQKLSAWKKEIGDLKTQAGIKEALERADGFAGLDYYDLDKKLSEEGVDEQSDEARRRYEDLNRQLRFEREAREREIFFSVSDVELRKRLIAKNRELDELIREEDEGELAQAKAAVDEASAAVQRARTAGRNWWLGAAAAGVAFVYFGHKVAPLISLDPVVGAMGGGVVAFFWGRYAEQMARVNRAANIKRAIESQENAKTALKEKEEEKQEYQRRWEVWPPLFFGEEAVSGLSDNARWFNQFTGHFRPKTGAGGGPPSENETRGGRARRFNDRAPTGWPSGARSARGCRPCMVAWCENSKSRLLLGESGYDILSY